MVLVVLTDAGKKLKKDVLYIPGEMSKLIPLDAEEAQILYKLLYKILDKKRFIDYYNIN